MVNYDLTTMVGQQAFEKHITMLIRNEINAYVRQVLAERFSSTYVDNNIPDPTSGSLLTGNSLRDARIDRLEQAIFRG